MIPTAGTADVIKDKSIYRVANTVYGIIPLALSPTPVNFIVGGNPAIGLSREAQVFVAGTSQPQHAICTLVAGHMENSFICFVDEETKPETTSPSADTTLLSPTGLSRQREIQSLIDAIFREAEDQDFDDGMESDFSRRLLAAIKKYGNQAMQEISYLIIYKKTTNEVASEALRWLGRIVDPQTCSWRLWLLEKSLSSDSPLLRDSAGLGLASMDNPHAIPVIRQAIAQEACDELRADLKMVLDDLEASQCHSS